MLGLEVVFPLASRVIRPIVRVFQGVVDENCWERFQDLHEKGFGDLRCGHRRVMLSKPNVWSGGRVLMGDLLEGMLSFRLLYHIPAYFDGPCDMNNYGLRC